MAKRSPTPTFARRCSAAFAAWLMVGLIAPQTYGQGDSHARGSSLEYAVKATYLYKFAPFVDWPPGAFASPSSAVNLCVIGDDPFGDILDRAVRGQEVGDRPIAVRRLRTVDQNSGCHIMYVTGSDRQSVTEALDAVRGTPVLTITNSASRAGAQGVIHFVIVGNRVRFEIDDQAAARNGITISSKLLSLAVSVRRRA